MALQINAFNFPVWGMLEKLAPAFLAGVPTVVKPASQASYLAEAVVKEIIASGLLPEGSLQLVAGGSRGLLDLLTEQDTVAFTGSASTAALLRSHRSVMQHGVRFSSEADSLNFSVLGVDVAPGSAEFDLYVRQLVTEMTSKAGQKCTAIRRALVPDALVPAVIDAVRARIADKVRVGDPTAAGVTMGALVGLAQRDDVRKNLAELAAAAEVVIGDPEHFDVIGADPERGAFLPPMLLWAKDSSRSEPHDIEVFGPVSTVLGYRDTAHAIELAARGRGSLVGSLVSADPRVVRDLVLGVAPWHGRVLVLDQDSAAESTGHGSPLPHLVHGGPGRAGDGEELGGIRGVLHYMQRTAIQGSPAAVSAVTGTWVTGAPRNTEGKHPFRKSLAELRIGDAVVAGPRTITLDDIEAFADLSGDTFYAHMDEEAAAASPFFEGRVAHGYFVVSLAAGLFVSPGIRAGAGQLRPGEPAVHHAGLSGRRTDRHVDGQEHLAARRRRLRRSHLGHRRCQPEGRNRRDLRRPHRGGQDSGLPEPTAPGSKPTASTSTTQGGDMEDRTPTPESLDPIERASVDEFRALQLERLQWSLRHAYDNVPHYRRRSMPPGCTRTTAGILPIWRNSPRPARRIFGRTTRSGCSPSRGSGSPGSMPPPGPPANRLWSATPRTTSTCGPT